MLRTASKTACDDSPQKALLAIQTYAFKHYFQVVESKRRMQQEKEDGIQPSSVVGVKPYCLNTVLTFPFCAFRFVLAEARKTFMGAGDYLYSWN